MPSYTLDASKQFMQTVNDLQRNSSANSTGEVIANALDVYILLKSISPASSNGEQKVLITTTDGKEYNVILP